MIEHGKGKENGMNGNGVKSPDQWEAGEHITNLNTHLEILDNGNIEGIPGCSGHKPSMAAQKAVMRAEVWLVRNVDYIKSIVMNGKAHDRKKDALDATAVRENMEAQDSMMVEMKDGRVKVRNVTLTVIKELFPYIIIALLVWKKII